MLDSMFLGWGYLEFREILNFQSHIYGYRGNDVISGS